MKRKQQIKNIHYLEVSNLKTNTFFFLFFENINSIYMPAVYMKAGQQSN